jgi:hypothetical protein
MEMKVLTTTAKRLRKMKKIVLTELENKCLNTFISKLYAEPGFSDVGAEEIAEGTGLKINTVKGVIGSLVKKGIIDPDPNAGDHNRRDLGGNKLQSFNILYLNEEYYGLHPQWTIYTDSWSNEEVVAEEVVVVVK